MKKVRVVIQAILLLVILSLALLHALDNAFLGPHALCPFAGLGTLYSLITTGEFVHRIHSSAIFLLLAVLITALLAGRAFCGWLCPFGTIMEWLHGLGKRLGIKKKIVVPEKVDAWLKYLKYLVLLALLYFTWTLGKLFYRAWCPWHAFMTVFDPAEIFEDVLAGFIILMAIFVISLFIERFFCRYLCPLGAAISIFNRFSVLKPFRKESCIHCSKCNKACPVGIKISEQNRINDPECIRCYSCFEACSPKNSMAFTTKAIKPYAAGLLVFLVFAGTVISSVQAGYWERGRVFIRDRGERLMGEEGYEGQGEGPGWGGRMIEGGEGSPPNEIPERLDDIKSFSSLAEVSEIAEIPLEEVYRIWEISESTPPDATVGEVAQKKGMTRRQLIALLSP